MTICYDPITVLDLVKQASRKFLTLLIATRYFRRFPPLLIVGSPRSGTTLLLRLLSAINDSSVIFEPNQVWCAAFGPSEDHSYSNVTSSIAVWRLRHAFYKLVDRKAPILVFKDPRDSIRLPLLLRALPHAKFIHILRDPRDVISSMTKTISSGRYSERKDNSWAHVQIPGYRHLLDAPAHIQAAYQWRWCVTCVYRDLSSLGSERFTTVRYEELVKEPRISVEKIATFAGLRLNSKVLASMLPQVSSIRDNLASEPSFPTLKGKSSPPVGFCGDAGSGTTSSSERIGKWREELTPAVLADCDEITGCLRRFLGYGD